MAPSNIPIAACNNNPSVGTNKDPITKDTPKLFTPITCGSVTFQNRIVVSPMCQYCGSNGVMNDYHLAHYGSFAVRGPGLIIIEASAVEPRGRISLEDLGLWNEEQATQLARVVNLIKSQGVVPGVQIAHAGRKANMGSAWSEGGHHNLSEDEGGWPGDVVGPSDLKFDDSYPDVHALTIPELQAMAQKWAEAAIRADKAGVEVLEIHSAHGYLLHNFVSGTSNNRTDQYGGSLENRLRFPLEVIQAVRNVWPRDKPLWLRLSGTDFKTPDALAHDEDGWDVYQATEYAKAAKAIGVDVIDVSAGGNLSGVKYPAGPLYQVPLSNTIKHRANVTTGAVGIITKPAEAEGILQKEEADFILLAREHLRDPAWTQRAAQELGVHVKWTNQYVRANREKF